MSENPQPHFPIPDLTVTDVWKRDQEVQKKLVGQDGLPLRPPIQTVKDYASRLKKEGSTGSHTEALDRFALDRGKRNWAEYMQAACARNRAVEALVTAIRKNEKSSVAALCKEDLIIVFDAVCTITLDELWFLLRVLAETHPGERSEYRYLGRAQKRTNPVEIFLSRVQPEQDVLTPMLVAACLKSDLKKLGEVAELLLQLGAEAQFGSSALTERLERIPEAEKEAHRLGHEIQGMIANFWPPDDAEFEYMSDDD